MCDGGVSGHRQPGRGEHGSQRAALHSSRALPKGRKRHSGSSSGAKRGPKTPPIIPSNSAAAERYKPEGTHGQAQVYEP